ncbi:MAG: hypothetical protein APF78_08005 [Sphingomonadales bacterium BRH_c3]|nr:MAG: hypothetical protein APF78_08005 [Sphingomonadales bacterium BRH_c3]
MIILVEQPKGACPIIHVNVGLITIQENEWDLTVIVDGETSTIILVPKVLDANENTLAFDDRTPAKKCCAIIHKQDLFINTDADAASFLRGYDFRIHPQCYMRQPTRLREQIVCVVANINQRINLLPDLVEHPL